MCAFPRILDAQRARILRAQLLDGKTAKETAFDEKVSASTAEQIVRRAGFTRMFVSKGEQEIIQTIRNGDKEFQKILASA